MGRALGRAAQEADGQGEGEADVPVEEAEVVTVQVLPDLTPSEADLYRLLAGNGYKVLRHGWPDYFVVPNDGGHGVRVASSGGVSALGRKPINSTTYCVVESI